MRGRLPLRGSTSTVCHESSTMHSCICVAFLSLAVLFLPREWYLNFWSVLTPEATVRLLTRAELSLYDGNEGSKGLYLAILGQVFDVHKGHKHYGPGGAYHFMAGNFCHAVPISC